MLKRFLQLSFCHRNRKRLLALVAGQLHYGKILTGNVSDQLAAGMMSSIVQGCGDQLSYEMVNTTTDVC